MTAPNVKNEQFTLDIERDYAVEQAVASERRLSKLVSIRQSRNDETLGDEFFKLAQIFILCSLPYSPTDETKITRKTRLANGSTLYVTFTAHRANIAMPFGADRQLLAWMFDKALRQGSPLVHWKSAAEYLRDIGKSTAGKNVTDIKERFNRVSGLAITVERVNKLDGDRGEVIPVIQRWHLPPSIDTHAGTREKITLTEGWKG